MAVFTRFNAFALLLTCAYLTMALLALPAAAENAATRLPPQNLQIIGKGTVSEILKPDLIRLSTGSLYVLDNIRVPALYADQALEWLDTNLLGKDVTLYAPSDIGDAGRDRMGNQLAQAVINTTPPQWVQGVMIGSGLAWEDSTPASRSMAKDLLAIEDKARATAQGFWAAPGMAVRKADAIGTARDEFMIITGTAVDTTDKKLVFFANYGDDWKTDFTIRLSKENLRDNFPPGFHIGLLKDKPIRIRGWVTETNGPMIELTHPEQLEFLPEEKADEEAASAPPVPASAMPKKAIKQ